MAPTYWQKQTKDRPLFPDVIWSKPENKRLAGKLLIVGGNAHGFTAPATAFTDAQKAGAGSVRVLLPDALERTIRPVISDALFAASTSSGSFARSALGAIVDEASWADGVLLAGDFGRNSETAIVIENFIRDYSGLLTITQDAINYLTEVSSDIQARKDTALVLNIGQLQKLFQTIHWKEPVTFSMGVPRLVDVLHEFSKQNSASIITKLERQFIVASGGKIATSPSDIDDDDFWRVKTAALASVWQLQNPSKQFEALVSAVFHFNQ